MAYFLRGIFVVATLALAGCQVSLDDGLGTEGATDQTNGTSGASTNVGDRSVSLYWSAPLERVNGEILNRTEIAGYEIRYRKEDGGQYERIQIEDSSVTQYHIDNLTTADYRFEVATIDTNGLYSDFVIAAR